MPLFVKKEVYNGNMEYLISYTKRAKNSISSGSSTIKAQIEYTLSEILKYYHGSIAELPSEIKLLSEGRFKDTPIFKIDNVIIPFKLVKVDNKKTKIIIIDVIY